MNINESQRKRFADELYFQMGIDRHIWVLTGDLGYGMFDRIRLDYKDRFINCSASEQAMMGIAVGLALSGIIPVVYSISTFLLYRPFETIRNYIHYEGIPVKLVGGGREKDYSHDGYSHWSFTEDERHLFQVLSNIKTYYPEKKEDITNYYVREFLYNKQPSYLNLRR